MTITAALLFPEFPREVSEEAGKGIGEAISKQSFAFVVGGLVVVLVLGLTWITLQHRRLKVKHEKDAEERRANRTADQDFLLKTMDRFMKALESRSNNSSSVPAVNRVPPGSSSGAMDGQTETAPTE